MFAMSTECFEVRQCTLQIKPKYLHFYKKNVHRYYTGISIHMDLHIFPLKFQFYV